MNAPAATAPEPLKGGRLILAAFALALANFIVVLDTTIANVSIPHIAGGLAVSPTQGTWAITSYAVADAISVPLTGWLSSRFGSVRWFVLSLVGFGLFSLLCGMATTLEMLIVFRIAQGFSGGPLMPLSQTLLLRIFPQDKAPIGLAIWAMTTTAAPILGPILGGTISDNWSWHWIFFINLPVVAICMFFVHRLVSSFETPTVLKRIDVVGLMLLILSVGSFQVMLDIGREHDWFGSNVIILLAVVAAIGFAAFLIWELTETDPIVDIRVFRHRGFTISTLAISLGFGAFFSSIVLTPLWLQQVVGYTATQSGYTIAWIGLFAVLFSPIAARLIGKIDMRLSVSAGILWLGVISLMRTGWTADSGYWTLAWPQILQGMGMPFFFVGLTALALGSVKQEEVVSAAGLMSFVRTLSGAIGTALATTAWDDASRGARSNLVSTLNNPDAAMAAMQKGGMTADQARSALDRLVEVQASTIGVLDIFMVAATVFGLAAILVWFCPKPTNAGAGMAAH